MTAFAAPSLRRPCLTFAVIVLAVLTVTNYAREFSEESITSFRTAMWPISGFLYWMIFVVPVAFALFFVGTCFSKLPPRWAAVTAYVLMSIFAVWFAKNAGLGGMIWFNLSAPFSFLPMFVLWALLYETRREDARFGH